MTRPTTDLTAMLSATHQDWQALAQRLQALELGWKPQALTPVAVDINRQSLTAEQALVFMADACGDQGWCQQASAMLTLPIDAQLATQQLPLLAEGVRPNHSWKLRHLQGEFWQLVKIDFRMAANTEEATHLAEAVAHLSQQGKDACLNYLRLWSLQGDKPVLEMAILENVTGGTQ
ncbi:hypothetical protein ACLUEY_09890 [Vreelandella aquamarina]